MTGRAPLPPSRRNLMVVDQISPGFSERYLLDPERFGGELAEYRRYITDIVRVFLQRTGQAAPNGTAESFAEDVLSFSTQLAGVRAASFCLFRCFLVFLIICFKLTQDCYPVFIYFCFFFCFFPMTDYDYGRATPRR